MMEPAHCNTLDGVVTKYTKEVIEIGELLEYFEGADSHHSLMCCSQ